MAKEIPKPEGWGELHPKIAKTSPRDLPSHYRRAPPIAFVCPHGPPEGLSIRQLLFGIIFIITFI